MRTDQKAVGVHAFEHELRPEFDPRVRGIEIIKSKKHYQFSSSMRFFSSSSFSRFMSVLVKSLYAATRSRSFNVLLKMVSLPFSFVTVFLVDSVPKVAGKASISASKCLSSFPRIRSAMVAFSAARLAVFCSVFACVLIATACRCSAHFSRLARASKRARFIPYLSASFL